MSAVVFETPGLIDVRAFTIMGAHAKPNSKSPIGFFGTGLKYAIAGLVRLGAEPIVWIGRDKLTFSKKVAKFRGTDLETIVMRVHKAGNKRPTSYELPFTTRYGANWKSWMFFRELESNTRDEGGRTYLVDDASIWENVATAEPESDRTYVIVDLPEFVDAAKDIDSIFLPRAKREGTLLEAIEPDDRPDEREAYLIYYRTMRAMTVDKPTLYTYNILEACELTEDRTLAYTFRVRDVLARWVLTEATEEQVEAIVTAGDEWWEHGLEFPGHVAPSANFKAVMIRRPKGTSRYASSYWSIHSSPVRYVRRAFVLFEEHPKPWKVDDDAVFDAKGVAVFERPEDMDWREWNNVAVAINDKLDAGLSTEEPESDEDKEEPEEDEGDPAEPLEPEETEPTA